MNVQQHKVKQSQASKKNSKKSKINERKLKVKYVKNVSEKAK